MTQVAYSAKKRRFSDREYIEGLAHAVKPGFKWSEKSMETGLAGGSYFRRDVILDAFADENVAKLDWNFLSKRGGRKIFSSDFAMPYLLAARGYEFFPWEECAQMDKDPNKPLTGPADAVFKHYSRGFPGGKPTYNIKAEPEDVDLVSPPKPEHFAMKWAGNCQVCWNLTAYINKWGSAECANHIPFEYDDDLLKVYLRKPRD